MLRIRLTKGKYARWKYLLPAVTALCIGAYLVYTGQETVGVSSISTKAPSVDSSMSVIAFISDTQAPLWIETVVLKEDRNEEATEAIFTSLSREPDVAAVFHLGDITVAGSWESEWQTIDTYLSVLYSAGIPMFPVPGNHDYYIFPQRGIEFFWSRFPHRKPTWYSTKIGTIAVVLLNSNFNRLSEQERKEQQRWYRVTLDVLEKDSTIKSIIVGTHHSPYTNSTIVDPSTEVQRRFVPGFLRGTKCRVFLSGHAHAFEHFHEQGKEFLVIGGGGGLLHPLLRGGNARWKDLFPSNAERRMFHYLLCEQRGDSLHLRVKMLSPDYSTFTPVYEITIGEDT